MSIDESVFKVGETYDLVSGEYIAKVVAIEKDLLVTVLYPVIEGLPSEAPSLPFFVRLNGRSLGSDRGFDLKPPKEKYVKLSDLLNALHRPSFPVFPDYGGFIYENKTGAEPAKSSNIADLPKYEF